MNDVPTYKREVGMMFQNYALFPHMTVAANIAYGLKARHLPKTRNRPPRARRADPGAGSSAMRIAGRANSRAANSSASRLARALVINPKVLLLDEPFSALDKNLRASMQVELREIQRKLGVTTVFVTHDQSEALSLSDRLAVMSEGRIRQLGTPEEIYRQPCDRFVASFVGDTNVLRARHREHRRNLRDRRAWCGPDKGGRLLRWRHLAVSAAVDLFVRPEQLRLAESNEPCASNGTIVAQVYQGGHVDIYLECADSAAGRVLARLSGPQAMTPRRSARRSAFR